MSENVVFALHGFLGQASDWKEIQKRLQEIHKIDFEAIDLFSKESTSIDEFEEYTAELSDEIAENLVGYKKKVFVGYSLGGRLGLHLLQENPDQFDHYVFISTNPGLDESEQAEKNKRLMADMKWTTLINEKNWDAFLKEWNAQPVFDGAAEQPSKSIEDFDLDKLKRAVVVWSVSQQEDFRELIQEFQNRITWVVGDKDAKYLKMAEDLKQKKILLDYKRISSGHRVAQEQPGEVAKLLSDLF